MREGTQRRKQRKRGQKAQRRMEAHTKLRQLRLGESWRELGARTWRWALRLLRLLGREGRVSMRLTTLRARLQVPLWLRRAAITWLLPRLLGQRLLQRGHRHLWHLKSASTHRLQWWPRAQSQ